MRRTCCKDILKRSEIVKETLGQRRWKKYDTYFGTGKEKYKRKFETTETENGDREN